MTEFRMPSLGADMEAGTVYDWRVKPGDSVKRGDVVASVETDKGVIDVEIFEDGVVEQILVEAGTRVPVGAVLAVIRGEEEAPAPVAAMAEAGLAEERRPSEQRPSGLPGRIEVTPARNGRRLKVSPAARKRAAELGIDLGVVNGTGPGQAITLDDVEQAAAEKEQIRVSPVARRMAEAMTIDLRTVTGTGPRGAISRADVERAIAGRPAITKEEGVAVPEAPPPAPPPPKTQADFQAGMRRAIAAAMSRSNRDIPHYYLETRIDMSRALRWLEAENLKRSIKDRILPAVLLIKATARALGDVPELNGYWLDDQLQVQEAIHVGFAIALRQGGLVTPAIHHADLKSLDELMAALRDLITRTRSGGLRSSELTDATITVTNLGDTGVEKVYGVIYPPQVALVGFGGITEQVWVENSMMGIRPVVPATLAGDHRATDGRRGGQFLDALNKYIEEPETL
ncbi:MAG TPA: 2-oxo acid dehydrogenase subunit E2 [Anaerolineae bacterium]